MITVKFDHKKHMPLIRSWYEKRGITPPEARKLPTLGFVVDNKVAGWLYQTDSTTALIDAVIADPDSLPKARRLALRRLAGVLTDTALSMGYTDVIFTSSSPTIQLIGKEMGFQETNQKLFVLVDPLDEEEYAGKT